MRLYLSSFGLGREPERLLPLLRGGRKTAVVVNAVDLKTPEKRAVSLAHEMGALERLGLRPTEFDLREHFGLAPGETKKALSEFDLVWVRGGNTFVLRRALRQSGADAALVDLLREDRLVYAGFSAATAVMGRTLRGVECVDGPNDVPEGYPAEPVWEGLGILPYAVVPHYRSDHPESEAVERLATFYIDHHVPFLALRDGEAIVRDGEDERVVGREPNSGVRPIRR